MKTASFLYPTLNILLAGYLMLSLTSCTSDPSLNRGLGAGAIAGLGVTAIELARGATTEDALKRGAIAGTVTAIVVTIVEKRRASDQQQRLAQSRAEAEMRRRNSSQSKRTYSQNSRTAPKPKQRYLAVETSTDQRTTSSAKNVMIYDTRSNKLVSNDVYDIKKAPKHGQVAKFESYNAEYIAGQ